MRESSAVLYGLPVWFVIIHPGVFSKISACRLARNGTSAALGYAVLSKGFFVVLIPVLSAQGTFPRELRQTGSVFAVLPYTEINDAFLR